jgi:hypothetical protein
MHLRAGSSTSTARPPPKMLAKSIARHESRYTGLDHISPPSVVKADYKLYDKSKAVTDYKEYPERTHYTLGQDGWEEVADFAIDWAANQASRRAKLSA